MKFYFKKLYIHFCFLALLNIFFSTGNIKAQTFSIDDIEISSPFEINFDKNQIIDKGFSKAFNQLILSIIQTKDFNKMKSTPLGLIKGMVETFSITEEKFVDDIYYLSLNVTFNKKRLFSLLESRDIFPSLPIKKKVFFIPIILDENKDEILMFSENYIFNDWNLDIKKSHLLEYILPTEDLEDFNLIKNNSKSLENYDFNEIIKKYNLDDYIISIVFKNEDEIRILNKIKFNDKMDLKNLRFQNLKLTNKKEIKKFTENLKDLFENHWKSKNQINTSVKSSFTVLINNNDNEKVSNFENTINNIELIYSFKIYKFNNRNNIYKIIFNGTPDYFLKIMNDKKYDFDTQNPIWSLK
tara:strand:- start:1068 stop:2132 length:1065 start_codon:yes stop_codon:yes gene_type:complete